ncbi:MAG: enoyl-CoA hydratase-related protein [Pseudomonadales bacterium]
MLETDLNKLTGMIDGLNAQLSPDGVLELCLDRPPVNAIHAPMWVRLCRIMRSLHETESVRSVLFTSANENIFSAGADMKERSTYKNYGAPGDFMRVAREATNSFYDCPVPVIVAATGVAAGAGAVLMGLADLVIGGPGTRLALTEIDRGVVGGSRSMARLLPEPLMRKMMLLGEFVDGEELHRAGAFAEYVPDVQIIETARAIACRIASKDPLSVRCTTQAIKEVEALDVKLAYRVEQKYTVMLRDKVHDEKFHR